MRGEKCEEGSGRMGWMGEQTREEEEEKKLKNNNRRGNTSSEGDTELQSSPKGGVRDSERERE